jgi:hypothetical protein
MRVKECTPLALIWIARATAVAMFVVVILFAKGEGIPSPRTMSIPELLEFVAMAAILCGFAAGWRHPVFGGLLILAAIGIFNLVELAVNGSIAGGLINWLALPGVLFIAAAAIAKCCRVHAGGFVDRG